jgi:hypothetical protein
MAYFGSKLRYSTKTAEILLGGGINTSVPSLKIERQEASYSRNTSTRNYPALSVAPGRTKKFGTDSSPITTPNGIGQRNNTYPHVHDGAAWKRWDGAAWQTVATVANANSKVLEFNTEAKRYTIFVDGTNRKSYDGTSVADLTDAPATNLYTIDDYRLYALLGSVLKCSAEGSITDWTTGGSADSIVITGMIGTGTAIEAFNDQVICWSEQTMHILYGDDPDNFSQSQPIKNGCIASRSVIQHNGILYFLDYGKFLSFTTGLPIDISQKVKTYLEGINSTYKNLCVAASSGKYIYLSIPYGDDATTNNITLELDTDFGVWNVLGSGYVDFVNIGEYLYGIDSTGVIYLLNDGTDNAGTAIAWSHITGVYNEKAVSQKKTVSDIWLIIDLPTGSTLDVSYSETIDGEDFTSIYTATASSTEQNIRVQVPTTAMQNVDWYRLKFSGTGPCTIHSMELNLRVKAR